MDCPKCNGTLGLVSHDGIEIDRCNRCGGLWFDMLESERLRKIKGSDALDSGDSAVGAQQNEMGKVLCPRCKTQMIRMVDLEQHHIWYESCPVCYGKWFDAGEFTDLKEDTVFDFFRGSFCTRADMMDEQVLTCVCPKCHALMRTTIYEDISVERCTSCGGIWFQWRTNQTLKEKLGAELVDSGNPQIGRMLNVIEEIQCPDCQVQMIPMVDQEQPHIWYECCPRCFGIFMDAGEFQDYKEYTVADFFRDLVAEDRM